MTEPSTKPLRLLLAEDHEWARVGLSMSIESKSNYKIVAQAENGQVALDYVRELRPDIVLMDIEMPVMDGLTATKLIKEEFPDMKVVMLTSHDDEANIAAALTCGANAYCMKDIKIQRLVQVLEMVWEGATWYDPAISTVLMRLLREKISPEELLQAEEQLGDKPLIPLTERELDVLELIVRGKSNKDIAEALNITIHTVKIHVGNVIQKMGVEDRTQVAIKALQQRLVQMPKG
ncbi:MAG TPA: response regulator transcription factor [Oculatellaceae cyanobacterium]|jgi:DNA-binding NarL/FixJ family response regulator